MNRTSEVTLGRRMLCWGSVICLAAWLAGCGGSSSGNAGQPPIDTGGVTIGASGGTVSDASGAAVIVPAGAFAAEATIRVAMDSSGAPALPESLAAAGNTYVITPHGGDFAQPVEVRIPAPNVTLQPNQELKLAKAQPGGEWVVLGDSQLQDGELVAQVDSFSFFVPVTVTYLLPLAQAAPFAITGSNLDCYGQDCLKLVGLARVTWTVATNNGQLPADCSNAVRLKMGRGTTSSSLSGTGFSALPLTGGSFTASAPADRSTLTLVAGLTCNGPPNYSRIMRSVGARRAYQPPYPGLSVVNAPAQLNVVAGLRADLDVVLNGGPSKWVPETETFAAPAPTNRAEIDWQRSDDDGASWRVVARSYQDEADPRPMGSTVPWSTWGLRHGFVASPADQGALIRVRACYTPPDLPAPPCVTSTPTRINVLQQSALPSIVDAPHSMLVRSGQTASLSATAGGAPVPTLQWQTRAANDDGDWVDVAGATGGSHTTAVLATADNGRQYRVVASNPLGSAASAGVSVSVSDLDVAPTITTQPASLSVASGSDAAFAIAAQGTEALSYQWRFNGIAISGANSPVLRLGAVGAGQAGLYSVVVSNSAGTLTSGDASLAVSASGVPPPVAPSIVTQPALVSVGAGQTATFAVGASGSAPLAYQWLRDGVPIAGANDVYYRLASATTGDSSTYSVRVSNSAGDVTSNSAQLWVTPEVVDLPVTISTHPSPQAQPPGGSATFAVAANGSGPFSYQWLKDGAQIPGATAGVLILNNLSAGDAASYSVSVLNSRGNVTSNAASLTIIGAPAIGGQPSPASATEGQQATFSVAASGSGLRYQWTRNHVAIGGATSAGYTTPPLALADSGAVYGVVVYNGAGVVFSQPAVLTVTPAVVAPTVTQQPIDATLNDGQSAPYDMAFGGTPPFTVQFQRFTGGNWVDYASAVVWSDNGVHRLSTGNLSLSDGGAQFRFVASNASGSVATNTVTVSFIVPSGPQPLAARAMATGYASSLVAATDGTVWAWGYQIDPATGGYKSASPWAITPVQVQGLAGVTAVAMSAEANSFYALHSDGTVSAWGLNTHGQLGDRSTSTRALPVKVLQDSTTPMNDVCAISASANLLVMTREPGSAGQCTGANPSAWIVGWFSTSPGLGGDTSTPSPANGAVAKAVPGLPGGIGVRQISSSRAANMGGAVLLELVDGSWWAWGANPLNVLGAGTSAPFAGGSGGPVQVSSFWAGSSRADIGRNFALALQGSVLHGVGSNGGNPVNTTTLWPISGLANVSAFSAGQASAAAVMAGELWQWGWNGSTNVVTPTRVGSGTGFTQVVVGDIHSLARGSNGAVYSWGDSSFGALGRSGSGVTPAVVMRP
jgi:alpha-tubulin suppressor-like RCC1 family protein